jgi:hypothetical protein
VRGAEELALGRGGGAGRRTETPPSGRATSSLRRIGAPAQRSSGREVRRPAHTVPVSSDLTPEPCGRLLGVDCGVSTHWCGQQIACHPHPAGDIGGEFVRPDGADESRRRVPWPAHLMPDRASSGPWPAGPRRSMNLRRRALPTPVALRSIRGDEEEPCLSPWQGAAGVRGLLSLRRDPIPLRRDGAGNSGRATSGDLRASHGGTACDHVHGSRGLRSSCSWRRAACPHARGQDDVGRVIGREERGVPRRVVTGS